MSASGAGPSISTTAVAAITTVLLTVLVCVAAATAPDSSAHRARTVVRSQVIEIEVSSLPESPAMDWSPTRPKWADAIALLPADLPPAVSDDSCTAGPVMAAQLIDHSYITYRCILPPPIKRVRDRLIALAQGRT